MNTTSENFFNIVKQPKDFCIHIDHDLTLINEAYKILNLAEDHYLANDLESFDLSLLQSVVSPNLTGIIQRTYIFENMILAMDEWVSQWISLYDQHLIIEKSPSFKILSLSELILLKAQHDSFKLCSNFFIDEKNNQVESIKCLLEKIENKEVEFSNLYDYCIYELLDLLKKLSLNYEFLRETAGKMRDCCNKDIKIRAKTQISRVDNKKWLEFMHERHDHNNSISEFTDRDEPIYIDKNY